MFQLREKTTVYILFAWFVFLIQLKIKVFTKPGGLDVETNRDRDRDRP